MFHFQDLDIIEILWKYDIDIGSADTADDTFETSSTTSSVSPPDEPFAPDGSCSVTPEITNPTEDAVPRNITTITNNEELVSEQVKIDLKTKFLRRNVYLKPEYL